MYYKKIIILENLIRYEASGPVIYISYPLE